MIKSKRKLNKQSIINVRRWTVVGTGYAERDHHFPNGTVIELPTDPGYKGQSGVFYAPSLDLHQWLLSRDFI